MVFLGHSYMPRPKNPIPSVSITFSTTPRIRKLLDELVRGQLHGKTRSEVVERMVERALQEMTPPVRLNSEPPPPPGEKSPKKKG
jgi:hypothetical protein